ncbi:beta-glucosidase [Apiospora phragmitis]|uniref:Beta-glucosidase n=1 Tax=Apiospora phragmitis TaxID=2905665 RepID=A0ABR1W6X6_9PEZI
MMRGVGIVTSWVSVALAQQVYVPAEGPVTRPTVCSTNGSYATATPVYSFTPFSFTQTETVRTATSVTPGPTTTYAPPYESLSHLVPDLATTTWGNWDPNATVAATDSADPYGQAAWSAIWERANLANFTYRGCTLPRYFQPQDSYYFPKDFEFGVAGSASQIEGAIADEGRTPTLMEVITIGRGEGDPKDYVTNENYYLYKQDIERLAAMGVKYYSFSIPWTRILPFALEGTPVNQQGLDHYADLIDFVIAKGMEPHVTLLHFDTPLQFYADPYDRGEALVGQNNGGYNNTTFQDAFVHYGQVVMTHFADRVPVWYTFNEPLLYCDNGRAVDAVVKAHARLYHFYHDEIKGAGRVALKFNDNFGLATFANPLFLGQDYPEAFKMTIPDYVPLTAADLAFLNGTADFLGIDPYTATVVSPPRHGIAACAANASDPLFPYCVQQSTSTTTGWNIGYRSESYVYMTPTYLRTYLNYLWNTFRHPVVITEFGFPVAREANATDLSDQLFDQPRSDYYVQFLSETLKAIWEDGVHVAGAFAWSFADNWEFGDYDQHFGIQTVNRTTMERRYKKSFFDLVDFVAARTQK